ncbi:MAG: hypothetical protein IAI50_16970 [Candidatus Eremiobacteraeota bacterium]|nr:hypothetical protein [Candidatus Eremiobacteraeota bacterium]
MTFALFGHHHDTPTLTDRASETFGHTIAYLHALPAGVWIAVIGGVAGIIGTVLNNRSTARREAKLATRAENRAAIRVKADLLVRLRAHCRRIDAGLQAGTLDASTWQSAHDDIIRRARDPDVIDALGPAYVAFMEAMHRESMAIDALRASNATPNVRAIVAGYEPFLRSFDSTNNKSIARV